MTDAVVADRRTLVPEVLVEDGYVLILRNPVLIETGERYWVDRAASCLVIDREDGRRERFHGDAETRCHR